MSVEEYIALSYAGTSASGKTTIHSVRSTRAGGELGQIRWYGPWRCYVFYPAYGTLYNYGCLTEIAGWCDDLTRAHRSAASGVGEQT